jgi:tRNA dimethylallyltransferase
VSPPRLVLLGPTAAGKTAVSLSLAERLDAEILNVDSRQIYRGMEIGSAAPTPAERARVRHHLVAEVEPGEAISAGEFGRRAEAARKDIEARGKRALYVGGSGLYLRAALGGLDELPRDPAVRASLRERLAREGAEALHRALAEADPETAGTIPARDGQRITRALEIFALSGKPASALRTRGREAERTARIVVLDRAKDGLEERIRKRTAAMVEAGLEAEVRALLALDLDPETPVLRSVGYAETVRFLNGELDRKAWIEEIAVRTRRFAKRQRTWFRGLEGAEWMALGDGDSAEAIAARIAHRWGAAGRPRLDTPPSHGIQ